jgi:hypothetical protein
LEAPRAFTADSIQNSPACQTVKFEMMDKGYLMEIATALYAEQEPVFIEGDGHYKLKVIAEPCYQNYLKSLCGGYSIKGSKQEVVVKLHYENGSQSDKNAIRVVVNGGIVGYLSPKHARLYRNRIEKSRQVRNSCLV